MIPFRVVPVLFLCSLASGKFRCSCSRLYLCVCSFRLSLYFKICICFSAAVVSHRDPLLPQKQNSNAGRYTNSEHKQIDVDNRNRQEQTDRKTRTRETSTDTNSQKNRYFKHFLRFFSQAAFFAICQSKSSPNVLILHYSIFHSCGLTFLE